MEILFIYSSLCSPDFSPLDLELLPELNAPNDILSLVHGEKLATDAHKFLKLRDPVVDPAGRMPCPFPAAGAYFLFEFMFKNFSRRCLRGCWSLSEIKGREVGIHPVPGIYSVHSHLGAKSIV